jgi:hypothetical protein
MTEPETMQWCPDCPNGCAEGPSAVVAWINEASGKAWYEGDYAGGRTKDRPPHGPRIVITGPNGTELVMLPGDEAVKGEEWFGGEQDGSGGWLDYGTRVFTVRKAS